MSCAAYTPPPPSSSPDALWLALSGTLARAGFEPSDFELRAGPRQDTLDLSGRLLMLRRRSTGHRRCYAVAPGSPWLFTAFADLTGGCFGQPAAH